MPTLNITINEQEFIKEITDNQALGIQRAMERVNEVDIRAPENEENEEDEDLRYISKEAYISKIISDWATTNSANNQQINSMIDQCINSWNQVYIE